MGGGREEGGTGQYWWSWTKIENFKKDFGSRGIEKALIFIFGCGYCVFLRARGYVFSTAGTSF
jgi:hypothetical protein